MARRANWRGLSTALTDGAAADAFRLVDPVLLCDRVAVSTLFDSRLARRLRRALTWRGKLASV